MGAPWGHITQGGQQTGALDTKGRVVAAVSIVLLLFMAVAVLSYAGLSALLPKWTIWPALAVQFISMILNWITPSRPERRLWGPIITLAMGLALTVVISA